MQITLYSHDKKPEWDKLIKESKNGTFLLQRDYMDYHSDRFSDCSLMVWNGKNPLAVLPANISEDILYSHQGLTYGGLIMSEAMTAGLCIETFHLINDWVKENTGVKKIVYKPTPYIYHSCPSEEDLFAIIQSCNAKINAREISTCINLEYPLQMTELRRRCICKAEKMGLYVRENNDIDAFWQILDSNLRRKYGVAPVHTSDELKLLKSRFPREIQLYMAYSPERVPLGGIMTFETPNVVHTQYISASPEGKKLGAIDIIVSNIIKRKTITHTYLDFGKSTERQGSYLNSNLIHQKEGFGGRAVCYDTYEWIV